MLSFQEYIKGDNKRLLEQIARNIVVTGSTFDDLIPFLPLPLNEGFFRRLGAAWHAFWNPDQETFTRQQVEEYVSKQTQAIQAQLQTMLAELSKSGTDKAAIQRMLEKMNAHFSGVAATLDHSADVDRAMAARSGGATADVTLPADPGAAMDALEKIPGIQKGDALNTWWNGLPAPDKASILKLLGLEGVPRIEGRLLRKPLEAARAAGKI